MIYLTTGKPSEGMSYETSDCPPPGVNGAVPVVAHPAEPGQGVGTHPHDGELLDGMPRALFAGGLHHSGFVLAKGAGPGIWNRWSTCTGGKKVDFARVHLEYRS